MPLVPAAGYPTESFPQTRAPERPPEDYLNIRATPEMFGAQVGQAQERLGAIGERGSTELAERAVQRQYMANQIAADWGRTQTMKETHNVLFGDPSTPGDTGFFGLHGGDVENARQTVRQKLDAIQEKYLGLMPNSRAKLEYNQDTQRLRIFIDRDIQSHAERELDRYGEEVQKDAATTAIASAGLNYNNPELLQENLTKGEQSVTRMLIHQGLANNQDAINMHMGTFHDSFVQSVVNGYLSHNDHIGAQKFLDSLPSNFIFSSKVKEGLNKAVHNEGIKASVINDLYGGGQNQPKLDKNMVTQVTLANAPGISPELAWATSGIESGFGANTGNKISPSNTGVFQMARADAPGGQNDTLVNQVTHGVKALSSEKAKLSDLMGRDVTDAEVYLAHQQGPAGATWLLTHPNEPAKNGPSNGASMAVKIKNNGGDPEAPARQFTNMWANKYARFASGAQTVDYSGMIEGLRDKYQNPEDFGVALDALHKQEVLRNTIAANDQAEKNRTNKSTADKYMQEILKPDANLADIKDRIATDPGINDYETRAHLTTLADGKLAGALANEAAKLGPGYFDVQKRIMLDPGQEGRIYKVNDILALTRPENGGWLTVAGAKDLSALLESRKTVDGEETVLQRHKIEEAAEAKVNPLLTRSADPDGSNRMSQWLAAARPIFKAYEGKWEELADVINGPLGPITKQFMPKIDESLVDKPPPPPGFFSRLLGTTPAPAQTPIPPGTTLHYNKSGDPLR